MSFLDRRAARLLLALFALVAALAGGEWIARAMAAGPPIVRPEQFADLLDERHRVAFEELFVADDRRFWKLAPGRRLPDDSTPLPGLIANQAGLREDHEIPRRKPAGETRILFVGDSTTFGYRVTHDAAYVEIVERRLESIFPGRSFECINAGVPGYTLFQGLRFLEDEGWDYAPDLVVLSFGWNGAESWDGRGDLELDARRAETRPPAPLDRLELARLAWGLGSRTPALHVTHRPRLMPWEFVGLLGDVAAGAAARDTDLLLLVGPGRSNLLWTPTRDYRTPLQEVQYAFGDARPLAGDGAALDLVPLFQQLAETHRVDELLFDSVHPTALGHRAIGEALARRLVPWVEWRSG